MTHAPRSGIGALRALITHHRNAPLSLLERMALAPALRDALHVQLRMHGIEAVVVSTCHRTELYYRASVAGDDARAEALWGARFADVGVDPVRLVGRDAAEHLFRVAAGLESLVLGEAEVLGQLRTALKGAQRTGCARPFLSRVFHAALRFGGRARHETGIGAGALSIASAAVRLLSEEGHDLSRLTVLVVGAGTMGLKAARHLKAVGVGRLVILNRTIERACEAARELGVEYAGLDELPSQLAAADAVVAAAQVEHPLLLPALLGSRSAYDSTPLTLIDLSLPRAIDPGCAAFPGVQLHNLADLEGVVTANRKRRETDIPRVEILLRHELEHLARWAERKLAVRRYPSFVFESERVHGDC
ncbi:MAG TPA: glutamyl-tRNA reductase [Methylomirabilota bacterium]|nr:glutamyl-tRNA reductase [Methylomirabilota bacterium]